MSMYFNFEEEEELHFTEGYTAIAEAMCDPASVLVVKSESGKYYVQAESVENYMLSNGIIDPKDAITDITNANKIDFNDISIVGISDLIDREKLCKCMDESCVYTNEAAAEDGATTLRQAEKWYDNMIKTCKSKAETKEEIDDCITMLKACVKQMEKAKDNSKGRVSKERVAYTLKSLIPFNNVWRLIRKHDKFAGISAGIAVGGPVAANVNGRIMGIRGGKTARYLYKMGDTAGAVDVLNKGVIKAGRIGAKLNIAAIAASVVVRFATYNKMLERCIKQTNEAIEYLEYKKDKLDNDSEDKK